MRSGRMKSSTAAPSFRNSGFETTENCCRMSPDRAPRPRASSSSWITARTCRAVPTGTVDLSTITLKPFGITADIARRREHILQVRRSVFVGGRTERDELDVAVLDARLDVGGKADPPCRPGFASTCPAGRVRGSARRPGSGSRSCADRRPRKTRHGRFQPGRPRSRDRRTLCRRWLFSSYGFRISPVVSEGLRQAGRARLRPDAQTDAVIGSTRRGA